MTDWLSIAQFNLKSQDRNDFTELDVQRLIIEPLLQWLGYDTFDFGVVKEQVSIRNSGQKAGQGRADYTIYNEGSPIMIIEAKSLTEKLDSLTTKLEEQYIKQTLDYCFYHKEELRWGILTNGLEWRIYDAGVAKGGFSDRCILTINVEQELNILNCLRSKNLSILEKYADDIKALSKLSLEMKERFRKLAYNDFISNFHSEDNNISKEETPFESQLKIQPQNKIPDQAIAYYNHPPKQGSKPSQLVLNGVFFETKNWSNVLHIFVSKLIQSLENPQELDGWTIGKKTETISSKKELFIRSKNIGFGLYLNTNYDSINQMKIIDTLIDKYGWKTDCYWVE